MRDIETIDGELGFVAALRRAARELCNDMPSTVLYIDALLDELFGNSSVLTPPKLRRLAPVAVEPAPGKSETEAGPPFGDAGRKVEMIPPHNDSIWPDDTKRAAVTLALAAAPSREAPPITERSALARRLNCDHCPRQPCGHGFGRQRHGD